MSVLAVDSNTEKLLFLVCETLENYNVTVHENMRSLLETARLEYIHDDFCQIYDSYTPQQCSCVSDMMYTSLETNVNFNNGSISMDWFSVRIAKYA